MTQPKLPRKNTPTEAPFPIVVETLIGEAFTPAEAFAHIDNAIGMDGVPHGNPLNYSFVFNGLRFSVRVALDM